MQTAWVFSVSFIVAGVFTLMFDPVQAQPKITEGDIYKSIKDGEAIIIISSKEIELQSKEGNFIGEYSVQGNKLRAIITVLGTKQALYFDITEEGLKYQKDGTVYYTKAAYERIHRKQEAERRLQEENNVVSSWQMHSMTQFFERTLWL